MAVFLNGDPFKTLEAGLYSSLWNPGLEQRREKLRMSSRHPQ